MQNKKNKLKNFSKNIQEARKKSRRTQKEIAKKIGITQQAYNRYESGKNEPGVFTAEQIANACGTTIKELLKEETEEKS